MKTRTGFSLAVLATAILLLCQTIQPTFAQDQDQGPPEPPNASQPGPPDQVQPDQGQPDQDPPTRAGRLSFKEGSVSFQPGGQGDWVDAVENRPLTTGDNFWVDKDSRAEIQIGGTSIRVGPETSVTFLDLGNNVTQLRLSLGSLSFRVRHFDNGETFEVDTPNLAFNVNQPGEFRLDVNQNGDQTLATIFHGEGEITGAGNSYRLTEGQQGTFSGTDQLTYDVAEIPQADAFTQWCQSRDAREDRAESRHYVSDEMTGYEDLDDYGRWQSDPDYGNVWYPTSVAVGWTPYRFGHWTYIYPWGWTWVEDEPWGFAPFHYGRWAYIRGGWGWVPGPIVVSARPCYAPALVAFVGGISIGVGTAPVGWFPLGPREVYVPWYRTSPRYVENVNVTNTRVTVVQVTNVYNNYRTNRVTNITYVNRRVTNSVTVVNRDTFINARPVHNNLVRVDARAMASARVGPAAITQFRPARQSVIGVAHPVQYHPPAQAISRPVVVTRQPVAYRRPGAPAFARPTAPPPVRTVRAAPPGEAQQLQRGARGGPANAGARPGQPNNGPRPGAQPNAPQNGGVAGRPGAPAGQPNQPGNRGEPGNRTYVPRPGAPNGQPNAPENRGAAPRPGAPGQPNAPENRGAAPRPGNPAAQPNENTPRPGGPANGVRPNGPDNSARPGAPQYNNRNVPRPPSASPQNQGQPQRQYPGTRPENNRPETSPQQQQPSRQVENPQARPENNRPEYNPPAQQPPRQVQPPQERPENNRPQYNPQSQAPQARPENARPENARPPEQTPRTTPQEPTRAPEPRPEPSPRQPETRPAPPPRAEQQRNARPEARPAPQRESRPEPRREEKPPKEDKPPKDNKH